MAKAEFLQPKYVAGFHCTGTACEETCCQLWRVAVDKKTYRRYRDCPDISLRTRLDKCVLRDRANPSEYNYAKIKMDDKGMCPFLDADCLCTLQRTLGEDYLSDTCAVYPRTFRKINGTMEAALQLSCPEAVRAALLNANLMEFECVTNAHDYAYAERGHLEFNSEDFRFKNKAERYFWPLRMFTISLLQNRAYQLWQRLVILGLFCQAVNNIQDAPDEIPEVIERYTRLIEQGVFKGELNNIPARYDVQVSLLANLIKYRMTGGNVTPQFYDCLEKMKTAIAPAEDADLEEADAEDIIADNYRRAFETYYRSYMDEHEYILENYLVNYVFKNAFPFGKQRLFADYALLVVHFAIIKMMLIGLAGYYKEDFSAAHIVQLIYSFSRTIEHHATYFQEVCKLFEDNNLLTMPHMAILIRN